jgi:hypothetical protein
MLLLPSPAKTFDYRMPVVDLPPARPRFARASGEFRRRMEQ